MTRRRGILSPLLALLAVVLAACAGLPTSGDLNYGRPTDGEPDAEEVSFLLPDSPQPGASPEQIVEGFIRAGSGPGLNGEWDRAREFLTPELAADWDPSVGVTVDEFEDRLFSGSDEGVVAMSFTAVATVDDKGAYERAEVGPRLETYELVQVEGEWRISVAPNGVVLDRDDFSRVFHRYSLMFFDPTWTYLVPDARWFPTTNAAASIAFWLVDGPRSSWLAESVATAFPESVSVAPSVPRVGSVAEVDLSAEALSVDAQTLNRMYTQLTASLETAGVSEVELTVGSTPLEAQTVPVRSTRVPGAPLVLADGGFGFLVGDEVEQITGLSVVIEEFQPVAVQVGPDQDAAAVRLSTGEVMRLDVDETNHPLDVRAGLVDPSIDPFGFVWSVPRDQPAAVHAFAPDGTPVEVADAWSGATGIEAMAVSRDGTRVAAVVTAGGRAALWVAGVVRNDDRVPVRLSEPVMLGAVTGTGRGLAWLDDLSIGVLSADTEESHVLEQVVGGLSTPSSAAAGMASIAGGSSLSSARLRAEDGTLYVRRGTSWQPTATGVGVLATQQGAPQ